MSAAGPDRFAALRRSINHLAKYRTFPPGHEPKQKPARRIDQIRTPLLAVRRQFLIDFRRLTRAS
jgi:hypothetical protein